MVVLFLTVKKMIQLSSDQRQAFQQGKPVWLHDPDLGEEVVVCPAALFEQMKSRLLVTAEDEEEQSAWLNMSSRTLVQRIQEEEND